jgi:uncharacterized membrane protein YraQ (UPF0718 family)
MIPCISPSAKIILYMSFRITIKNFPEYFTILIAMVSGALLHYTFKVDTDNV